MVRKLLFAVLYCAVALCANSAVAQDWSCNRRPYCTQMRSCAEADFYLRQCGHGERDGDNDGIPCEALCGKTWDVYMQRRGGTSGQSTPPTFVLEELFSAAG